MLSLMKEEKESKTGDGNREVKTVSLDGKVVRGSFDNFKDQKAIQVFSALLDGEIILAHEEIEVKTNEIPVAQKFFEELGLKNHLFTLDALHCQKKRSIG